MSRRDRFQALAVRATPPGNLRAGGDMRTKTAQIVISIAFASLRDGSLTTLSLPLPFRSHLSKEIRHLYICEQPYAQPRLMG